MRAESIPWTNQFLGSFKVYKFRISCLLGPRALALFLPLHLHLLQMKFFAFAFADIKEKDVTGVIKQLNREYSDWVVAKKEVPEKKENG